GLPSRTTSVMTATTDVVISEKSKLELLSCDLSGIAVSRMSTIRSLVSFHFDIGGADDRPPLLGLRLVIREQGLRCLLLARRNLTADLGKLARHAGSGERLAPRGIGPRADLLRRTLRPPHAVPERHVHAGRARLVGGRDVRRAEPALLRHHGVGLDLSGAD